MNIDPSATTATTNRRRRTARTVAVVAIATTAITAGSSAASDALTSTDTTEPAPQTTSAPEATAERESTIETYTDGTVRLTFSMPDGWDNNGWFLAKTDSDPTFGVIFFPVVNIFADPCQSVAFDPPVGPTVEDLASAFADVPALNATAATDVTVDGFHGMQFVFTVPDYDEDECRLGRFALFQDEDDLGNGPGYWAQGPRAHHRLWILDIDGTRYVIGATYFPDTSQQDRNDIDAILDSIQIEVVTETE